MERRIAIADASPLIGLASVGAFDLLRRLFGQVVVTAAVRDEVYAGGSRPGAAELRTGIAAGWIVVEQDRMEAPNVPHLGYGEASALAFALHHGDECLLLMDESRSRTQARRVGIPAMGIVGILLEAKRAGMIPAVSPFVARLLDTGFRLSDRIVRAALLDARETPPGD